MDSEFALSAVSRSFSQVGCSGVTRGKLVGDGMGFGPNLLGVGRPVPHLSRPLFAAKSRPRASSQGGAPHWTNDLDGSPGGRHHHCEEGGGRAGLRPVIVSVLSHHGCCRVTVGGNTVDSVNLTPLPRPRRCWSGGNTASCLSQDRTRRARRTAPLASSTRASCAACH